MSNDDKKTSIKTSGLGGSAAVISTKDGWYSGPPFRMAPQITAGRCAICGCTSAHLDECPNASFERPFQPKDRPEDEGPMCPVCKRPFSVCKAEHPAEDDPTPDADDDDPMVLAGLRESQLDEAIQLGIEMATLRRDNVLLRKTTAELEQLNARTGEELGQLREENTQLRGELLIAKGKIEKSSQTLAMVMSWCKEAIKPAWLEDQLRSLLKGIEKDLGGDR